MLSDIAIVIDQKSAWLQRMFDVKSAFMVDDLYSLVANYSELFEPDEMKNSLLSLKEKSKKEKCKQETKEGIDFGLQRCAEEEEEEKE